MNDIKKLILYIENEMKNVKKLIVDFKNKSIDQNIENAILKIKESVIDYKNVQNITDEELTALKNFCDDNIIYNLKGYKAFISSTMISINELSKQKFNGICNKILGNYESYKKENFVDSVELDELDKRFNRLKSLRYKLTDSFELKPNDIDLVVDILKQNNIEEDEIIEHIIYIITNFASKFQDQNLELENFIQEKISLEEITELFNLYNYNFDSFNKKQQEKILSKGNLNNIRGILEVLANENINLNEPFNSKTILTGRANQLCEIFVYSTPELVSKIIDTAKNKIKLYNGKTLNFVLLIERPGIFIIKRRHSKNENKGPIDLEGDTVCGCHEDFLKNIDLIYDKYQVVYGTLAGFDEFFRKSKHTCVFETSHKKIKNIVDTLELYGLTPQNYLRALSSFNSTTHADALDVAIELGCYEYIKDNPSKLTRNINSEPYTQLAIARNMCHLADDQLFNRKNRRGSNESYIDLKEKELSQIININGLIFRRFKLEDNYDNEYLKLFEEIESKILLSETTIFDLAIKDLDQGASELNKLESYVDLQDQSVYEINGIRVSRNKVLRLYHILKLNNYVITPDVMVYIMTRNSYLTQEQFERLRDGIIEIIRQGEIVI